MPTPQERTPRERETLIFRKPEQAEAFAERVGERVHQESGKGVTRRREVVAEEVSAEFDRHGEAVTVLSRPWEHTKEEHDEVQLLVDLAFEEDLPASLRQIQKSDNYPRVLDLFHDVLTGEMYKLLQERGLNRQPATAWPIYAGVGTLVVLLLIVLLIILL